uniref:Uncharacterized protein n=1 Tax=Oryza nivara TaxID=4536 RepID=A0A0E0GFI1_ORYNI
MRPPELIHLLHGQLLGLREEEEDEERHDAEAGGEEEEGGELEVAEHGEEGLADEEGEEEDDGDDDALPRRPHLQRADLGGDQVGEGPPRPGEARDEDAHDAQHQGHQHRDHQLRPVPTPEHVPQRVPDRLGHLARHHQVLQLLVHRRRAAQPLQQRPSRVHVAAALDHEAGRLRQEQRAHGEERRGDGGHGQGDPPPPPALDLVHAVVDEVSDEDADADAQLEPVVDGATVLRRRHLRQIQRDRLQNTTTQLTVSSQPNLLRTSVVAYLVGEAESNAEQDPVEDEHVDVDSGAAEDGAGDEDGAADEYGGTAAEAPGDGGGDESGDEAGDVEGGGEDGEELAVKAAVVAHLLLVPLHLMVHVREELLQERLHRRYPTLLIGFFPNNNTTQQIN